MKPASVSTSSQPEPVVKLTPVETTVRDIRIGRDERGALWVYWLHPDDTLVGSVLSAPLSLVEIE